MVKLRCIVGDAGNRGKRVAGRMAWAAWLCLGVATVAAAQHPPLHFQHAVGMPPGAIGNQQLQRGGPLAGYFQPVEIKVPQGALISLAEGGTFSPGHAAPLKLGLLVGQVYRICVFNIPLRVGQEIYPTIEVIDRLYTPTAQELRFPIQIELTQEDLEYALAGKFVTRVVYLEDPERPMPIASGGKGQSWFETEPGTDPLIVADGLGRPMAIVRLGGRLPDVNRGADLAFLFGCPPLIKYPPPPALAPQRPTAPPAPGNPFIPENAAKSPAPSSDTSVQATSGAEIERRDSRLKVLPPPPRKAARTAPAAENTERQPR